MKLDPSATRQTDDAFYARHPEMVRDGKRVPIDPKNPAHKGMASEWMGAYRSNAAPKTSQPQPAPGPVALAPPPAAPPAPAPGQTVMPCPAPAANWYDKARDKAKNADQAANSKGADWKLEASKGGATQMPGGRFEKSKGIDAEIGVSKQKSGLVFGEDGSQLTLGKLKGEGSVGYSYDENKDEHFAGAKGKAEAMMAEYKAEVKAARGLVAGEAEVVVGKVGGEAKLGIEKDPDGARLAGALGAEAVAVSGKAKGQVNVTPKTIYDNACNLVAPGSNYCNAPTWLDHGVVAGIEGEAGIGAVAKVEGAIGKLEEGVWGMKGGAKVGKGPMAGLKVFFGLK
jgi:hypothetical protein